MPKHTIHDAAHGFKLIHVPGVQPVEAPLDIGIQIRAARVSADMLNPFDPMVDEAERS
jgi:hypothetical protein